MGLQNRNLKQMKREAILFQDSIFMKNFRMCLKRSRKGAEKGSWKKTGNTKTFVRESNNDPNRAWCAIAIGQVIMIF